MLSFHLHLPAKIKSSSCATKPFPPSASAPSKPAGALTQPVLPALPHPFPLCNPTKPSVVREDISQNLHALEDLHREFNTELLLIESGGDNLAANYSRELADYIIYVIDVSGGDKIPRKGGPGITQSDLLVVNKTDLAELIGADLGVMDRDARKMREGGPTIFAQVKNGPGVKEIVDLVLSAWRTTGAEAASKSV